jgi:hypothetical protein
MRVQVLDPGTAHRGKVGIEGIRRPEGSKRSSGAAETVTRSAGRGLNDRRMCPYAMSNWSIDAIAYPP